MSELTTAKKTVIEREVSCLLEKGLAPNLMSFVSELLGPEGLRRRSAPASSGATATTSQVSDGSCSTFDDNNEALLKATY